MIPPRCVAICWARHYHDQMVTCVIGRIPVRSSTQSGLLHVQVTVRPALPAGFQTR